MMLQDSLDNIEAEYSFDGQDNARAQLNTLWSLCLLI